MPSGKANKRLRKEQMADQYQNLPQQSGQPVIITQEEFKGPLPDPQMLERYRNADPSFPERIMRMAEAHNAADINTKNGNKCF